VEPKNIAFIHVGMPVKVQVESFNYNEWGTIDGKVSKISSDYIVDNDNNYLFKIKVKLSKDYLEMKSARRRGYIKKGMTAIAHFVVTRQSLFELLYKNIDNWMNPTQYKSSDDKKQE
jgi:HlyD family secretion protein